MPDTLETNLSNPHTPTERKVAELGPWFHNLHLPDGTQTAPSHPLGDFPAFKWKELAPHLPRDMTGMRALDIGCNAGFYTFELARRGAAVTAIDVEERYLRQARWAAARYGLTDQTSFRKMQIYDLVRVDETYEVVLFLGVFYHLRYPLLALDLTVEKTERLLAFQTLTMPSEVSAPDTTDRSIDDREALSSPGWPKMAFIEHRLAGDPTNWWVPNTAAIEAMLRSSGLQVVARPGHGMYMCRPDASAVDQETYPFIRAQLRSAVGRPR